MILPLVFGWSSEMAGLSFYITVGKTKQIVTGLHQDTIVENVVQWLCRRNNLAGKHVLMEVWRGCSRPMNPKEKLLESFLTWGSENRHVTLKLVSSKVCRKYHKKKMWMKKKQKTERKFHSTITGASRVYSKHYPRTGSQYRYCELHRQLMEKRLHDSIKESIEQLKELQVKEEAAGESQTTGKTEAEIVSFLNPYLQGEYISSKNNVTKTRQMKKELEKHKKELEQNINNRQSEILSLETNVEGTQEKIDNERTVLGRQPPNIQDNQEYKQANQKLEDLKNHLRAKQKISQLQSSKMQELVTEKNQFERLVQVCEEEIRVLRSQTYKSREEEEREMV